ncbi:unnamed protein product [Brassica oleracea var. botrytis]|uniref:(rape) hypothetical protein n=1 Tax=Brassica napus TaxID=3708 RepID=A0A816MK15_BRANA|nr:unnamed protein product [Brassica napus]
MGSKPEIQELVNAEVVTKAETMTIAEIYAYIKQAKISVYDNNEQVVFILLGDGGRGLTGKHAAEVVDNYFEANQNLGADHQIHVPEALINTIGQTHKFSVKVSEHNLTGMTHTITVTKILSPAVLPAGAASVENHAALTSEADGDRAGEGNKSICHSEEPKKENRPKHDN